RESVAKALARLGQRVWHCIGCNRIRIAIAAVVTMLGANVESLLHCATALVLADPCRGHAMLAIPFLHHCRQLAALANRSIHIDLAPALLLLEFEAHGHPLFVSAVRGLEHGRRDAVSRAVLLSVAVVRGLPHWQVAVSIAK